MLPQGQQFFDESQQRSFEKGSREGEVRGKASAIIEVLHARGLSVSDEQRERILACTDLEKLKSWTRQAVMITSTDELFV